MREVDPLERVLDAGEVGLRRIREQAVTLGLVEMVREAIHAEIGGVERHVRGRRSLGAGELADAVDRVVVVEGGEEPVERIGLADEPQGARGVRVKMHSYSLSGALK